MGSVSYNQSGGNTQCAVTVYYDKTATGASFYFTYAGKAEAEWYAPGGKESSYWRWKGNNAGYVQMDVDGNYTNNCKFTNAKGARNKAGDTGGPWFSQLSGTSSTVTLPGKNTGYVITVRWSGSMTKSAGTTVYYTFNLPIYINADGTVKQVEKAYANVNGVIKECTVYVNVNGVIKELK